MLRSLPDFAILRQLAERTYVSVVESDAAFDRPCAVVDDKHAARVDFIIEHDDGGVRLRKVEANG